MSSPRTIETVRPSINLGRIVFTAPYPGWYQIEPYEKTFPGRVIYGYGVRPDGSMTRTGTSSSCSFSPGDEILYMSIQGTKPKSIGMEIFEFAVILGCFPWQAMMSYTDSSMALPRSTVMMDTENVTNAAKKVVFDTMSHLDKSVALIKPYGRVSDAMSGDFVKMGAMGTLIKIGMFQAVMRASYAAGIEFNFLDDSALLTADSFNFMNPSFHDAVIPSVAGHMRICRQAYTAMEGCGSYATSTPPFFKDKDTGKYSTRTKDGAKQQGIFRTISMSGWEFGGRVDAILEPEDATSDAVRTNTYKKLHKPLMVEHRSLNGSYNLTAATRVRLARSPLCILPMELDCDHLTQNGEDTPSTTNRTNYYSDVVNVPDDDKPDYSGMLAYSNYLWEMTRYTEPLFPKEKEWKTFGTDNWPTEISKASLGDEQALDNARKAQSISAADPGFKGVKMYELPKKDPTGVAQNIPNKLTALMSAIELTPDGAIVIQDGHGSELRMHRGNVTLSVANDLKIIIGRDTVATTGRNMSVTGHNHMELASETGKVMLKAEQDMMLMSGNGGMGSLTLENRSDAFNMELDTEEKMGKDPWMGGVCIKSKKSNVAILSGRDMRIGLIGDESTSASRKGTDDSKKAGTIVLDAGKGTVAMRCGQTLFHALYGHSIVAATESGENPAILSMTPGMMGMLSQSSLNIGTSMLNVGSIKDAQVKLPVITRNGVEVKSSAVSVNTSYMKVNGGAEFHGSLRVKDGITAEGTVLAEMVMGVTGWFTNANKQYSGMHQEKIKVRPKLKDMDPLNMSLGLMSSVYSSFKGEDNFMSDLLMSAFSFSFLQDDETGYNTASHFMVQPMWQYFMKDAPKAWEHKEVKDWRDRKTSQYPGHKAWMDREDYVRGLKLESGKVIVENKGPLKKTTRGKGV